MRATVSACHGGSKEQRNHGHPATLGHTPTCVRCRSQQPLAAPPRARDPWGHSPQLSISMRAALCLCYLYDYDSLSCKYLYRHRLPRFRRAKGTRQQGACACSASGRCIHSLAATTAPTLQVLVLTVTINSPMHPTMSLGVDTMCTCL